jgi:type VI secretion system protein ImpB
MKSVYDKLEKVRKPRVHITYDVETENGVLQKELPFVVGVMGEYSGNASPTKKSLKERKFVQIDADNFNDVMKNIAPEVSLKVKNTLANDDSEMSVNLKFNSMDDFEPTQIARQIDPLKNLLEVRTQLSELLSKADRSENLEALLEDILKNNDQLKTLASELNSSMEEKPNE